MKRKLAILMTVVFAVSLLGAAAMASGDFVGTLTVVNCDSWVSLRSAPSTNASRVTTVPKGARVDAYYYNSQFYYCNYNGWWGYILTEYLSASGGNNLVYYVGTMYVVRCESWVTLRSRPSTSADTVTRVPLGAAVEAYYYNTEFMYCEYCGMSGYILSSYLSDDRYSSSEMSYIGTMRVSYCDSWVTLRSRPSTSADSITRVPLGALVEAYYYNTEWAYCKYNGMWGYILRRYLS